MKVEIEMDRRRPKRQRTPTTLYTDDNPSTFTTKFRKGEEVDVKPPKPSFFFVEEDEEEEDEESSKRPNRRRKPYHKDDMLETSVVAKWEQKREEEREPPKRKRGRPPKNRPVVTVDTLPPPPPVPATTIQVPKPKKTPSNSSARPIERPAENNTVEPPPAVPLIQDLEGTFFNHAVRIMPILPSVLGDQPPGPSDAKLSQWAPLFQPVVYFDEDYENDLLPDNLTPVTRSITCMTTRKPDHKYLAVGDTMGFCTIYCMEPRIRPVARLETVACQQRAREEQEKIRDQQRRKRKSLVVDTSATTVHALGMIGDRVVIATACELECMDIPSQTSLWVCPLAQDRLVTSLDMHPTRYDVLVSCSIFDHAAGQTSPLMLLQHSQNNVEVCDANAPILLRSPCCTAIWDNSKNVENRLLFVAVADEELELILVQGGSIDNWKVACKTRIPVKQSNHDTSLSQSPNGTYTLVACSRGIRLYQTETLELIHVYGDQLALHGKSVVWKDCLMIGKSLSSNKYKCSDGVLECEDWLQESDEDESDLGQYVVGVPHFKGPKELTETLHVWRVELSSVVPAISIPLPPKAAGVQAIVAATNKPIGDGLILAGRDGQGYTLLPTMTSNYAGIMYPPGYQVITDNIEYIEEEGELDQVVVEKKDEESEDVNVLEEDMDEDLKEAMRRSLLEQKESVDQDVDIVHPIMNDEPSLIPCRPEAYLRQAVNSRADEDLDDDVNTEDEDLPTSPSKHNNDLNDSKFFVATILESLGHTNPKKHQGGGDFSFSVTAKVVISSAPAQPATVGIRTPVIGKHGKRSRSANLDAVIKSSIDPKLQRFMYSKQACGADGRGSSLRPAVVLPKHVTPSPEAETKEEAISTTKNVELKSHQDEAAVALGLLGLSPNHVRVNTPDTEFGSDTASRTSTQNAAADDPKMERMDPNCHACRGRLVIHTCGSRAKPIDFDEVAKVEREQREKEDEEKKKVRAEKRRQADQRRREARKQKQRELEEQRRREEEQIRLEKERLRQVEQVNVSVNNSYAQSPAASELERQRREMIVASYANHISQPTLELNSVDYSRQAYAQSADSAPLASPPIPHWEPVHAPPTLVPASIHETREISDTKAAFSNKPQSLPLTSSTSMGTLSSADALVALASFAGIKAEQQHDKPLTNGQPAFSVYERTPAAPPMIIPATTAATTSIPPPSHGFGAGIPIVAPKRAIPSFAALRSQGNGQDASGTTHVTYETMPVITGMAPDTNGHSITGGGPGNYVWPPRVEADATTFVGGKETTGSALSGIKWPSPASTQIP